MTNLIRKLYDLAARHPMLTWFGHAAAVTVLMVPALLLQPLVDFRVESALVLSGVYFGKELFEVLEGLAGVVEHPAPWWDHLGDWGAPQVVLVLLAV